MRVLVFCFLALLPLGFTKKCNEHCEACDGDADIAVIRCTGKECTVESKLMDNQNQTINMDYLKEGIEDLTPEVCRAKCQEQSVHEQAREDKNCEYFHWQEVSNYTLLFVFETSVCLFSFLLNCNLL